MVSKDVMAKFDETRWNCGSDAALAELADYAPTERPVDHAQKLLLEAAIAEGPDHWVWDPRLVLLFARLNAKFFDGRVRPHRLFWFHEQQLDEHGLCTPTMYNRIAFTFGYRADWSLVDGVRYVGLHLRLKIKPDFLYSTIRHEMVHDLCKEQAHGEEFIARLQEQDIFHEDWVARQVEGYRSRNRVGPIIREAMDRPWTHGDGHDPDADVKAVRAAIQEHELSHRELHQGIEAISPAARFAVLRAVELEL